MRTKNQIKTRALRLIGDVTLTNELNTAVEDIFQSSYQDLLSEDYWFFAQDTTSLGMTSSTYEIPDYKYKYTLPADYISIGRLYNSSTTETEYKLIGNNLYSNTFPLTCEYVSSKELGTYLPWFAKTLAYLMATELCIIFGSSQSQASLFQLYQIQLISAHANNGKNMPSISYQSNWYSSSRHINHSRQLRW